MAKVKTKVTLGLGRKPCLSQTGGGKLIKESFPEEDSLRWILKDRRISQLRYWGWGERVNIKEMAIDINRGVATEARNWKIWQTIVRGLYVVLTCLGFSLKSIHQRNLWGLLLSREAGRPGSCHFGPWVGRKPRTRAEGVTVEIRQLGGRPGNV